MQILITLLAHFFSRISFDEVYGDIIIGGGYDRMGDLCRGDYLYRVYLGKGDIDG